MTRWIGQRGQCLLCYYGLSLRPNTKARSYATSFSSNVRPKKSLKKSTRQEEREERVIERRLSREQGSNGRGSRFSPSHRIFNRSQAGKANIKDKEGSSYKRMTLHFDPESRPAYKPVNLLSLDEQEKGHVDIFKRLEECFKCVWRKMGPDALDDELLLKDLDPSGDRWPKFADNLRQLFGMPTSQLNGKHQRLYTDLIQSLSSNDYRADTPRLIRFAFFDHALNLQGFSFHQVLEHVPDMYNPTEWYPNARTMQRQIHLHVGPTNSGKTYNALKQLEAAPSGYYAGPLRLLAHEVYSRFLAKGIPCDLVTGDDVRLHEDAETRRTASTVEMVNIASDCDVAVIDEIQMIADEDRGWAWTRALLGTQAREVHLCGEERTVPLIQELAATMGDNLKIHRYERLNPLKATSKSLRGDLKNLRKGDCVVSFSVVSIHAMKNQIERDTGRHAAIVYGSLPPEVRAQQAALFNDPDNDYDFLVASNAIGMGLNLSIKRIVFESLQRFNGTTRERISVSEIKQIAGRAGRYKTARDDSNETPELDMGNSSPKDKEQKTVGLVTCLDEKDMHVIQDALSNEAPPVKAAGLLPPGQYIEEFATRLPKWLPFEYLYKRTCEAITTHSRYSVCDVKSQLAVARSIESVKGLSIAESFTFVASPADGNQKEGVIVAQALAKCIAEGKEVTVADIPEIPLEILELTPYHDRHYLRGLEVLHKSLILYLWLSYRFSSVFKDMDMAFHAKELVEEKINFCLTKFSANPKLRARLEKIKTEYRLSQEDLQNASSDAQTTEERDTSTSEGEAQIVESSREAPREDESSELDLAMQELEHTAKEAAEAIIYLSGTRKDLVESSNPNSVSTESGNVAAVDASPDADPGINRSDSGIVINSDRHTIASNTTSTIADERNPISTPNSAADAGTETPTPASASALSEANPLETPVTEPENGTKVDWADNNEARPVFIPTDDHQPPHGNETSNSSR